MALNSSEYTEHRVLGNPLSKAESAVALPPPRLAPQRLGAAWGLRLHVPVPRLRPLPPPECSPVLLEDSPTYSC